MAKEMNFLSFLLFLSLFSVMDLVKSIFRPVELAALVKFKMNMPSMNLEGMDSDTRWCWEKLAQTSRSFTIVIQRLHQELMDPVSALLCSCGRF
jgi:hypothetical protein